MPKPKLKQLVKEITKRESSMKKYGKGKGTKGKGKKC